MTADAYFVGRAAGKIQPPYRSSDQTFGSQRLDGVTLEQSSYEHCTFANISFKAARLDGGRFLNCAFVSCFFRKTDIRSCSFSSCRFIDCEFPDASFSGCDFRYARFAGCYVPFNEIVHNLPPEPNLREQLSHNLAREAALLGDSRTARTFRLCEVSARESHYWAAVCGKSKWYRDHYVGLAKLTTALRLVVSKINGWLFGYGERLWAVFRNYGIATFVIFPSLFYAMPDALLVPPDAIGTSGSLAAISAALEFSLSNAVAGALRSPIEAIGAAARVLAAAQIVLTAVWASLVAGYLFRWSLLR
jgi:hypothetical protein